ncbi:MAG TPA: (2Fe-2S)-binding protein [Actinobacteria bacterium]|nr:(2Fe-2S)-binding protein [Actinomycetota bacterium]
MSHPLRLTVNDGEYLVIAAAGAYLLDVLRDDLGLQGTKEACAEGECGSCTVLIDGEPVDSCIYFAAQATGKRITTVEGLGRNGAHPVQRAFAALGAVQCGFCTPGFVVAAAALLQRSPNPGVDEIREALAGNLCRCTGYNNIVAAVLAAAGSQDGDA